MKQRRRIGYVVAEKLRNGFYSPINVVFSNRGNLQGITGFGELYFRKTDANRDCQILYDEWEMQDLKPMFKVFKAELSWEE